MDYSGNGSIENDTSYDESSGNYSSGDGEYTYYYEYDYTVFWEHRGRLFMFKYIAPIIILLGTLGNLISFIVLQHKSYRKTSTGFILSALAVVDTGMLNTGLLRHFIMAAASIDVRSFSTASCRVHYFFTYFFKHASPMTITLMTTERVCSVWMPFKVKSIFSRRNVAIVWVICIAFLMALNSHGFVTVELYGEHCYFAVNHTDFHMGPWYWVDAAASCYLPIVIIFAGNVLIIAKVHHSTLQRKSSMGVRSFSRSVSTVPTSRSTTIMLLTVSIVFLICILPQSIYLVGTGSTRLWPEETYHDDAKLDLAYALVNMFFYINNAINFPLYCLAGTRFRRVMKGMLCSEALQKLSATFGSKSSRHSISNGSSFSDKGSRKPLHSQTEMTQM